MELMPEVLVLQAQQQVASNDAQVAGGGLGVQLADVTLTGAAGAAEVASGVEAGAVTGGAEEEGGRDEDEDIGEIVSEASVAASRPALLARLQPGTRLLLQVPCNTHGASFATKTWGGGGACVFICVDTQCLNACAYFVTLVQHSRCLFSFFLRMYRAFLRH